MYTGLRFCADHYQTRCCGREAIPPASPDMDYRLTTEDETPITTDEFPEAELVCPDCGRTFGAGECQHENIELDAKPEVENGQTASYGDCQDCGEHVWVALDAVDVRVMG